MAAAKVTICLPFFNDRRQRLVTQTNSGDASSYAKNPRQDFINWATSMVAALVRHSM
jgi:hypothetical protein